MDQRELSKEMMNAFKPFGKTLPETYVDCRLVRGDWDISVELGRRIEDSKEFTCQLFSGHIGSGKSSELIQRLQKYLEGKEFLVVYFDAHRDDMSEDVQYVDILLACVENLLKVFPRSSAQQSNSLVAWFQHNWEWLQQFFPEKMTLEEIKTEVNLGFGKLIATLKNNPDRRPEIRRRLNEKAQTLLMALNEFIDHAQKNLPDHQKQGIVMIVDSLDRVLSTEDEKRQSWRDIYISRSQQMRGLRCHVVYTVDVDMVYSDTGAMLQHRYDDCLVMPMVTVRHVDGRVNRAGINALRQLVQKRIAAIDPNLVANLAGDIPASGEPAIFASSEILDELCLMSGGRMRTLMHLVQNALKYNEGGVTITERSMHRSLQQLSSSFSMVVDDFQWEILARIAMLADKTMVANNSENFTLLRKGHLLDYRDYQDDQLREWRDVHPLITMSRKFQDARRRLGGDS